MHIALCVEEGVQAYWRTVPFALDLEESHRIMHVAVP